jgi:acetylornithine deacetylase/succinyl-diaminopimelate desuccinylase-like protein
MVFDMIQDLKTWYKKNSKEILSDYFTFLKFKTISAKKNNPEMISCCKWLSEYLKKIGLKAEIINTPVYPLVYGEMILDKKLPTLMIYGHYDVQPIDPIEQWKTEPFEPTIVDGEVYARGASDNKGQIFYSMVALRSLMELNKKLKVNIKFCIEGDEESSSKGLFSALDSLKDKLKSDYLLVVDFGIPKKDEPAITLGIRGLTTLSLEFTGSSNDLHSGEHGGLAYNPLRAVCELLGNLIDENGKVRIEHFYDDVEKLEKEEIRSYNLDFDVDAYKMAYGMKDIGGEKEFKGLVANWFRPTVEINGISGGYFNEGFKTVIPSKVQVKLSARLVPNQDPNKIAKLIKDFLEKKCPKAIEIKVKQEGGGKALRSKNESKIAVAASKAYEEVYCKPCKKILAGGSVPVVAEIVQKIKCEPVMMGTSLPDDNIHAPNEHFGLDRFEMGFLTVARTISLLGEEK